MSILTCLGKLKNFMKESGLNEKISDDRLLSFARHLEGIGGDSLTPAEFNAKAQEWVDGELSRDLMKRKIESAMVALGKQNAKKAILANIDQWQKDIAGSSLQKITSDPHKMPTEAVRTFIEGGSPRPGQASNIDPQDMASFIKKKLMKVANEELGPSMKAAQSARIDDDTIREWWAENSKMPLGQTNNPEALVYAKALKSVGQADFDLRKLNNPYLEAHENYLVKQSHNRQAITDMGKDAWVKLVGPLENGKALADLTPTEKVAVLGNIYDRIVDGRYGTLSDTMNSSNYENVSGPGRNILRSQTSQRILEFKDAEALIQYRKATKAPSLWDTLDRTTSNSSRDIALMSKFTPNPERFFSELLLSIASKLHGEDALQFKADEPYLKRKFAAAALDSQNAPSRGFDAKINTGVKVLAQLERLGKTGGAVIRSQNDLILGSSLLKDLSGKNLFGHAFDFVTTYAKGMAGLSNFRDTMGKMGLFSSRLQTEMARTLGSPESEPGALTKMADAVGTISLMNRHVDNVASASGQLVGNLLANVAHIPHAELPPSFQLGLKRYGIDAPLWDTVRQFGVQEINGEKYMTPDAISQMPRDAFLKYLKDSGQWNGKAAVTDQWLDYQKFQAELKLGTMMNEHADLASAHAGTRQRSFLWGEESVNSGAGMLRKMLTQFQQWAWVSADIYKRNYFTGSALGSPMAGVASHFVGALFVATVADLAHQIASGKTPEDVTQAHYPLKMIAESGVGGMYADFLAREAERSGSMESKWQAGASMLLGPSISTLMDAGVATLKGAQDLASKGELSKGVKQKGASLALGMTPGVSSLQSLFYTKAAFNYYFANALHEFLGSGYMSSQERRTNQTPGLGGGSQSYLFGRPTSQSFLEGQ